MSLSNTFDVQPAQDFLKGLIATLNDYDQFQDGSDRPRMVYTTYPTILTLSFSPSDSSAAQRCKNARPIMQSLYLTPAKLRI